ncbi:MAG: sn-glycerol-3-phosphate ABC transporter ATP-binding protein UgpC [Myxococcota bacterium]
MITPKGNEMASLSFKEVHKSYGNTTVIERADLEIADGEFIVLVGPSGCGKSTLLRMVAGLETVTSGEIYIASAKVNSLPPKERDIAMVFQSYALYPHMTVRENLAFSLKVRGFPEAEINMRVEEAAVILGLTHLIDRYPAQLSGGQRQRVAMGRAIVRRPKVFLFDEPLSNLDAALRSQMRVELKKLHKKLGATIIYVTHDQVEALTLADRIVVLNKGVIQQVGTPDELYLTPANMFVASFIGSPAMNFLEGKVSEDGSRVEGEGFYFGLNTPWWHSCAEELAGMKLIVGLRPPHLVFEESEESSIIGALEVIEPMGWETYLHLNVGGKEVTAQVESYKTEGFKVGDRLRFSAAPFNIHLFNKEEGYSLRALSS